MLCNTTILGQSCPAFEVKSEPDDKFCDSTVSLFTTEHPILCQTGMDGPMGCYFLTLPLELREMINTYASSHDVHEISYESFRITKIGLRGEEGIRRISMADVALNTVLVVCHQLRDEVKEFRSKQIRLHVELEFSSVPSVLRPLPVSVPVDLLKSLRICTVAVQWNETHVLEMLGRYTPSFRRSSTVVFMQILLAVQSLIIRLDLVTHLRPHLDEICRQMPSLKLLKIHHKAAGHLALENDLKRGFINATSFFSVAPTEHKNLRIERSIFIFTELVEPAEGLDGGSFAAIVPFVDSFVCWEFVRCEEHWAWNGLFGKMLFVSKKACHRRSPDWLLEEGEL